MMEFNQFSLLAVLAGMGSVAIILIVAWLIDVLVNPDDDDDDDDDDWTSAQLDEEELTRQALAAA